MKKKYKLKKSAIVIISIIFILIIALIIFIVSLFKTKSYSIEYNINDYQVSEYYDDENKLFYYELKKDNITYNFLYESKYIKERKLINDIKTYTEDETTCLIIQSEYIKSTPLCSIKTDLVDYHLMPNSLLEKIDYQIKNEEEIDSTANNYILHNNNIDLYIWNYKGFNHIHNGESNLIRLFDQDIYDIPLAAKINNYLIVPDYEQEYTFNKVYIIDLTNNEVDDWTLKANISFDSYVIGTNDKSLYIVDQKNKREYELVPHKKKMRVLATSKQQGTIYNNGVEKKVPMKTLIAEPTTFTYKHNYNYKIIDNKLYLSYLNKGEYIKVSNNNITSIISIDNDTIYYLVGTTLYRYNLEYGETKLVTYSEWEFNNKNVIFINS